MFPKKTFSGGRGNQLISWPNKLDFFLLCLLNCKPLLAVLNEGLKVRQSSVIIEMSDVLPQKLILHLYILKQFVFYICNITCSQFIGEFLFYRIALWSIFFHLIIYLLVMIVVIPGLCYTWCYSHSYMSYMFLMRLCNTALKGLVTCYHISIYTYLYTQWYFIT